MKTIKKFLGIIALVAIIGFSMITCDDGGGSSGGGPGGPSGGGGGSKLTVNNIPSNIELNGIWVYAGNSDDMVAFASSVTKSPFSLAATYPYGFAYTGSGSHRIEIYYNQFSNTRYGMANLSNGSATINWNTMADR